MSLDNNVNTAEPYLRDLIIDLQNSETWKSQLTRTINFISSKHVEEREIHSKSDNIKFPSYNNTNKVADEIFDSIRSRYQHNLEKSVRRSEFIFHSV